MKQEIKVRHGELADIAAIKSIYAQQSVYHGTLQLPFPAMQTWEARLTNLPAGHYNLVAEMAGQLVGQLGLHQQQNPRRKHVASVGMGVSEQFQGQGVGSALLAAAIELADKWLNIKRLELEVYTDNLAAIALYKKYGFYVEGEAKGFSFRNGSYADIYFMARVGSA